MYLGLPILAYGVQYNRETTEGKALYFDDKDGLVGLLKSIDDEELSVVARDMLEIAKENYVWEKIAKQYAELF
jgi:glycosyltransferase involved in cell wall biosynthesis